MRTGAFITGLLLIVLVLSCQENEDAYNKKIEPYVSFLKDKKTSAKDYIMNLFDENDIVIICERFHPELTQYELLLELANDPRFIENIGTIFIEVCVRNQEANIHNYLLSKEIVGKQADSLLLYINRNNSVHPLWTNYNFSYFLKGLKSINDSLDDAKKVRLYPSDVFVNWPQMDAYKYKSFWDNTISKRDEKMAQYIINKFDSIIESPSKRKKALVIQNYRHAFANKFMYPNNEKPENVGRYLFEAYSKKIANVLLNTVTYDINDNIILIADGKWDASFKVTNRDDVGFNFNNTPFGNDYFDLWPWDEHDFSYSDIFNGFVQYKHVEDFKLVSGVENIIDSTFLKEVRRRKILVKKARGIKTTISDSLIWSYNTRIISPISDSIDITINKWIN